MAEEKRVVKRAALTHRVLALLLAPIIVAVAFVGGLGTSPAEAADASGFKAGHIISDANFYNGSAMTTAEVQTFLEQQMSRCTIGDPGRAAGSSWGNTKIAAKCLKDFKATSISRTADGLCKSYAGVADESASQIIAKVGKACGISQKVLLVMLEKEQTLISDSWPTVRQYDVAMGYACPDSGPGNSANCDPKQKGFANQVYRAAWVLKYYKANPNQYQYKFGKTNTIQWHPDAGCGTSQVYIENAATAALYIYTPYRPNQAALNAGWGTGDGCSTYGNRNFYLFYSSWFGSPTASPLLVKADGQPDVYLVIAGKKHHIQSHAYAQYLSALGPRGTVSASYVRSLPTGVQASLYVKNKSTGEVAFLDGGKSHRFASCALVADWGGACGEELLAIPNNVFAKFASGSEMTSFAKSPVSTQTYRVERTALIPYYDLAVAAKENNGKTPYAATLPSVVQATKTITRIRFDTDTFVRTSGNSAVLLPLRDGRTLHLGTWAAAAELGLPNSVARVIPSGALAGYRADTKLGIWVKCGAVSYMAAGGSLNPVNSAIANTFQPTTLDASACASLKKRTVSPTPHIFVKASNAPEVYSLENGERRHVTSRALLDELSGSAGSAIYNMRSDSLQNIPLGTPLIQEGTFIRASNSKHVYLYSHGTLTHLSSWEIAKAFGLGTLVTVLPPTAVDVFPHAPQPLGLFAECNGTLLFASNGVLRRLAGEASVEGNAVSHFSAQVCRRLSVQSETRSTPLFVTDGARIAAPALGGFLRLDSQDEVDVARAGYAADPITISPLVFDLLPHPAYMPTEGTLARSSGSSEVFLIDAARRARLPNWGIAADLGISVPYEVYSAAALGKIAPTAGLEVSPLINCGAGPGIAGSGTVTLLTVEAIGNLSAFEASQSVCDRLNFAPGQPNSAVQLRNADGSQMYLLQGGKLTKLAPQPTSVPTTDVAKPSTSIPTITMDSRSLATLVSSVN